MRIYLRVGAVRRINADALRREEFQVAYHEQRGIKNSLD